MNVYESNKNKSAKAFQIVMGITFITICIVCLLPIVHVVSMSFSSKEAILSGKVGILPVGINFQAYEKIFSNSAFIRSFAFSITLTAVSTAVSMLVTILAAYPLSKSNLKGKGVIMFLLVITMYFDPGIIPNYLNVKSLNLLDSVWALIIPGMMSVYNLIILKTFFSSIESSLFDAAKIDGAGELKILFKIAIPLSLPAIATLSLFYAVGRWNGVSDVLYYISDSRLYTVQMMLKQMLDSINVPVEELDGGTFELVAENVKSAAIVFSMIPMAIVYPFIQKYFTGGIMLGSVKG